jgi:hypothetical protein
MSIVTLDNSYINVILKINPAKAFRGELGTNNPVAESSSELLKNILVNQ